VAAGAKIPLGKKPFAVVLGPEIYGATPFQAFMGGTTTALEGLLSGRIEGTGETGLQLPFKMGAGAGLDPHFGAPEWRLVMGLEVFGHQR